MSRALLALTAALLLCGCDPHWITPIPPLPTMANPVVPPTVDLMPTVTPDLRTPTKETK